LDKRTTKRVQKFLERAENAKRRGTSLLEEQAITPATTAQYRDEVEQLKKDGGPDPAKDSPVVLDAGIVQHFENLFFKGMQPARGMKLLGAVMHFWPQYGKLGGSHLPRAWRALKGWRRLAPGRSRVPEPLRLWCGMAVVMALLGFPWMGVFCMLSVSTYLRPSSLLGMEPGFLVRPALPSGSWSILAHPEELGRPSKTGEFDLSMRVDSKWILWIGPLLEILSQRPTHRPVWQFNYYEYATVFRRAATTLEIDVVPYQTRHSGASIDRASAARTLGEVQARGAWRSAKSVVRYDKHARLQHSAQKYKSDTDAFFKECELHLADAFLAGKYPVLPSRLTLA